MTNPYYNHGSYPAPGAAGASAGMRSELDAVAAGFDKMAPLSGNQNKVVVINGSGTGQDVADVTGTGNFVRSTSPTLNSPTLVTPALGTPASGDGTNLINTVAPQTHAAAGKTTPVDADEIPMLDSAASFGLKKLTWANLKAALKTYFDGIYTTAVAVTSYVSGLIGVTIQAYDIDTAKTNVAQTFTAQQTPMKGALTDGSTVDWNGNTNGQSVKLTTAAARTFNAPTNIIEDNLYVLRLTTGGFTPSWNAAYKWATVPSGLESATYTLSFIGGAGNTLIPMGAPYKTGA